MVALPEEILLLIFDELAPVTLRVESIARCEAYYRSLCAAALVCRAWAPSAQRALFRHVSISQTSLAEARNRLPALVFALQRGHSPAVRILHFGLGAVPLRDGLYPRPPPHVLYDDAARAAHLELVARALPMCTNLVHLSLQIGLPFDRAGVEFSQSTESIISQLSRLRRLSLYNVPYAYLSDSSRGPRAEPGFSLGMQLLRTFAPQLAMLDMDYWIGVRRTVQSEPLALPALHTLRASGMPEELATVAMPALAHVHLDEASDLSFAFVPDTVSLLALRAPIPDYTLARLHALETLVLAGAEDLVLGMLEYAPISVRVVEMSAFTVRDEEDVKYLKSVFSRLERLERLVLVDSTGCTTIEGDYEAIVGVPVTIIERSQHISFPWDVAS